MGKHTEMLGWYYHEHPFCGPLGLCGTYPETTHFVAWVFVAIVVCSVIWYLYTWWRK